MSLSTNLTTRDAQAAFLSVKESLESLLMTQDELAKALHNSGRSPTAKMLAKYWTEESETSGMKFERFMEVLRLVPMQTAAELRKTFRKINTSNDGWLTYEEFAVILKKNRDQLSDKEIREIFDTADANHDGKLDFDEFAKMVVKTAEETRLATMKKLKRKEERVLQNGKTKSEPGDSPKLIVKPSLTSVNAKYLEPANLQAWNSVSSKGNFFFDEYNDKKTVIGHQYQLDVAETDKVYLTVAILPSDPSATSNYNDILILLLNEENDIVAFTSHLDPTVGLTSVRYKFYKLQIGEDVLGCNCVFQPRSNVKKLVRTSLVEKTADGILKLNKQFKLALMTVFDLFDLDSNGFLSREEFNLYNLRTGDDEVTDEEWVVVRGNFENKDDQLTMKGFIQLHQLEAEDAGGDTDDMWLSLKAVGFNEQLILDEAYPFLLTIYTERTKASLTPMKFSNLSHEPLQTQLTSYFLKRADRYYSDGSWLISLFQTDFVAVILGRLVGDKIAEITQPRVNESRNVRISLGPQQISKDSEQVINYVMPRKVEEEWQFKFVTSP